MRLPTGPRGKLTLSIRFALQPEVMPLLSSVGWQEFPYKQIQEFGEMPKAKHFVIAFLLLTFVLAVGSSWAMPVKFFSDEPKVTRLSHPFAHPSAVPGRDDDQFMTFRWMYSDDGVNWNPTIFGAGNTGMFEVNHAGQVVPAWADPSYNFGVLADAQNNIHFVACLTAFSDSANLNPLNRNNGVYDVRSNDEGGVVSYNLIAQQPANHAFTWSDCGKDTVGNLYAIWLDVVENAGTIWAAKSTNNGTNWSQPFQLVSGLSTANAPYPHMTQHVAADFFYVIYQQPDSIWYSHKVLKVPSSLSGQVTTMNTGAKSASGGYVTYYVGSVNAIDMDPATGDVYFCVRNSDLTGTSIGNLAGNEWSITNLAGAQRYPSIGMDIVGGTPFVFSNTGVPAAGGYHHNWFSYDALGYRGGQWVDRKFVDSLQYGGVRSLLYCNQGVWGANDRLVLGENVWGQFTPEGFQVNYSDDNGATWHHPQQLYSVFSDNGSPTMSGGFIAQNELAVSPTGEVFVAFCGKWGVTDVVGPTISAPTLSSFAVGHPWQIAADLNDENGVGGTTINWLWTGAAPDAWAYADADSGGNPADQGNGHYYYHLRNDSLNGHAITSGDSIRFYIDATDLLNNYRAGWENLLIVGTGYQGVWKRVEVPLKTELGQNYPNPFNNTTTIPFALDATQPVRVQVWDTNGRLVSTLTSGKMTAGNHTISWNTDNVTSGVYIYTLETTKVRLVSKMTLVH